MYTCQICEKIWNQIITRNIEKKLTERGSGPPHAGVAAGRFARAAKFPSFSKNLLTSETNPHLVQKVRSFKLGVPSGPLRSPAAEDDLVSKRFQIENLEIPQFVPGMQYGGSACLSHPLGPPRRHRATADITELQLCCVEVSTVLP